MATPLEIAKDLSEMCRGLPCTISAIPEVMSRWSDNFVGRFKPNWYLPIHLGGFGLDIKHSPCKWKVTKDQRRMAQTFVDDPKLALYSSAGEKVNLRSLGSAKANWRMVVGDYVPLKEESTEARDAWLARFCYASRAMTAGKPAPDPSFFIERVNCQLSQKLSETRSKPMAFDKLSQYWCAQVFAHGSPVCPPLGVINRRMLVDSVVNKDGNGVSMCNSPKRCYGSWEELDSYFQPELNNSVLNKMPRDYTALRSPPTLNWPHCGGGYVPDEKKSLHPDV